MIEEHEIEKMLEQEIQGCIKVGKAHAKIGHEECLNEYCGWYVVVALCDCGPVALRSLQRSSPRCTMPHGRGEASMAARTAAGDAVDILSDLWKVANDVLSGGLPSQHRHHDLHHASGQCGQGRCCLCTGP